MRKRTQSFSVEVKRQRRPPPSVPPSEDIPSRNAPFAASPVWFERTGDIGRTATQLLATRVVDRRGGLPPASGVEEQIASSPNRDPSASDGHAQQRRVLPDLIAEARVTERLTHATKPTSSTRQRDSNAAPSPRRRPRRSQEPVPDRAEAPEISLPVPKPVSRAHAALRRKDRGKTAPRLSRAERWKERRLPRVCWIGKSHRGRR